jgi:hypothetical protein
VVVRRGTVAAIAATHSSPIPAITPNDIRHPASPPITVVAGTPTTLATVTPSVIDATADERRSTGTSDVATNAPTPMNAPCGRPDRNRATSNRPRFGAMPARALPAANKPMNNRRAVRRWSRTAAAVSSGAPTTTPTA